MPITLVRDVEPGEVLTLSPHLTWDDEIWLAHTQQLDYARDGTPHIELWPRKGGRPVTLRPAREDQGLMSRALLETLWSWAATPTAALTLTLHDETPYAVVWRTPFITAVPGVGSSRGAADERWRVTLYFMIPDVS